MVCNALPAILNMIGDYIFVFPCRMGIEGASLATGLSELIAAIMIAVYIFFYRKKIRLYRLKFSRKSLRLTLRNVGHQMTLGTSSMIGELALS